MAWLAHAARVASKSWLDDASLRLLPCEWLNRSFHWLVASRLHTVLSLDCRTELLACLLELLLCLALLDLAHGVYACLVFDFDVNGSVLLHSWLRSWMSRLLLLDLIGSIHCVVHHASLVAFRDLLSVHEGVLASIIRVVRPSIIILLVIYSVSWGVISRVGHDRTADDSQRTWVFALTRLLLSEHVSIVCTLLKCAHVTLLERTRLLIQALFDTKRPLIGHIGILTEPWPKLTLSLSVGTCLCSLLEIVACISILVYIQGFYFSTVLRLGEI